MLKNSKIYFFFVQLLLIVKFEHSAGKSVGRRAAHGNTWPSTKIPYEFSNWVEFDYKTRQTVEQAIQELEGKLRVDGQSCIEFYPRDDENNYILFVDNGDCSSSVGYLPGKNLISLNKNCIQKSSIIHELMHRLGFHHEHSRFDRDDYVEILDDNILSHPENFEKIAPNKISEKSPYDFYSITHYNSDSTQNKNGQPTLLSRKPSLLSKDNKIEIKRESMSQIDVLQVQTAYKCKLISIPDYSVDEHRMLSFKKSITERLTKEALFRGISQPVIDRYLERTFGTCGLDHYWPVDYPLVDSQHPHYKLVCKAKKETNQKCKYSIECKEDAFCVRPFFYRTGLCISTGNEKIDSIGQAINDEMFDTGKKVKDTAKKTGSFIKDKAKIAKNKIEEGFDAIKNLIG